MQILDFAAIELVNSNIFRELDLNAHASLRDILRRQKMMELETTLGDENKLSTSKPGNNDNLIATAIQNPVQRLLHRIFWIWPEMENSQTDDKSSLIPLDYYQTAITYWENKIKSGKSSAFALHNLAVIYQSVFLAAYSGGKKFSQADEASGEIETYCRKSLEYWEKVAASRNFWQKVFEWAAAENDPRLGTEFLQELKRQFLPFLIVIFLDSAWRIYQSGHKEEGLRIIEYIQTASFTEKHQSLALDYFFTKLEKDIRAHLNDTELVNGSQKPAMLYAVLKQSVEKMNGMISFARPLVVENPQRAFALMDSAAMHYLDIISDMKRHDEYLFISLRLLEDIAAFPVSGQLVSKADDFHKDFLERKNSGNTWFTDTYFELKSSLVNDLEKARGLFEKQDHDGALKILEAINLEKYDDESSEVEAVRHDIAILLTAQGANDLGETLKELNKPRILYDLLRTGNHQQFFGISYCEACGAPLHGRYYEVTVDSRTYRICANCGLRDKAQINERRSIMQSSLTSARDSFSRALKMNPNNKVAKENLDRVYEFAHHMEITLPSMSAHNKPPSSAKPRQPQYAQSESTSDNSSCLFFVVFVVALFLVLMIISQL